MGVSLTSNFFKNARGVTFGDANGIAWSFNPNTNTLTAAYSGAGSAGAGNPTAKVGIAVANGSAATFMRSDGAPPLDLTISPTWTGSHTFSSAPGVKDSGGGGPFTVGYLGSPFVQPSSNYGFTLPDSGKTFQPGAASLTFTLPSNASVAFPVGTTIFILTSGNSVQVALTTDTLLWLKGGSNSTGTRTIAAYSNVTLYKYASTVWAIYGSGIS